VLEHSQVDLLESPTAFDHSQTGEHRVFLEARSLATPRALRLHPSALVESYLLPLFVEVMVVIESVGVLRQRCFVDKVGVNFIE
jgi:hypothetical protein